MNNPVFVAADADGNVQAPWFGDAETNLRLAFDTGELPIDAQIDELHLRVQGESIAPSYLTELQFSLQPPVGSALTWDAGADLGFPESAGGFDSGTIEAAGLEGRIAEGTYNLFIGDNYNETGNDFRIDDAAVILVYSRPADLGQPIGPYLDNVFPSTEPANDAAFPATLSGTGAFTDLASLAPRDGLIPYGVNSPLWSDSAVKQRWIAVPRNGERDTPGELIDFRSDRPWTFPAGTVAVKHFDLPINERVPELTRRLETRFLVATGNGGFYGVTYRWRADESDADLLSADGASADFTIVTSIGGTRQQRWNFPSRSDCRSCHNQGGGVFLGANTWQLNGDFTYLETGTAQNQLVAWKTAGLFATDIGSIAALPAAASLDDTTAPLEDRVRSYLAANCANCHNDSSTEDLNADFDLSFWNSLAATRIVDGIPLYNLGVNDARVLKPGEPEASVMLLRMNAIDQHKMPPIGRNTVDEDAVAAVRAWITQVQDPGGQNPGDGSTPIGGGNNTDIAFTDASTRLADPTSASGVAMAVVDMNQDGRDDIVHLKGARALHIDYQPTGNGNFTTRFLGTPGTGDAWGMAVGDLDNNGYPDIVTGGYYDGLHIQRANASATAYTSSTLASPSIFLQGVAFTDIDNDGWIDLFPCHDEGLNPPYRNQGNGTLVHTPSLINTTTFPASDNSGNYGLTWTDYDGDGDVDLYIAKCRGGATEYTDPRRINQLFRNDNGFFTEVAADAGLADGAQSWTADFGDIDNDGDLDCFIGNHGDPSRLLRNEGDGTFTDITDTSGVIINWRVIQAAFRDFNGDGWIDLLLAGADQGLYLNKGDGTFRKAANPFAGIAMESFAIGDLNTDGFPDIYAGYARIYNTPQPDRPDKMFLSVPNGNNVLSISLTGRGSNRLASGTRLELHGPWGVQVREIRNGEGYGVCHSLTARFGLGDATSADKLVIRWPSGEVQEFADVTANQFLRIEETHSIQPADLGNRYGVTFLVPSGGQTLANAYQSRDWRFNPLYSTDMQSWAPGLESMPNPGGLPIPPPGYEHMTFCMPHEGRKGLYFRVDREAR